MTLILKLDRDMVNMYLQTKIKFLGQVLQKLYAEHTHTHTHTHNMKTLPTRILVYAGGKYAKSDLKL